MRAMAPPVQSAAQVPIAFDCLSITDVQHRAGTRTEFIVCKPHSSVLDVDYRTRPLVNARISTDAVQSPCRGLHAHTLLDAWDNGDLDIWLDEFDCTTTLPQ